MAKKAAATKTLNPLPFEHLEPHRFEDLIRRLLYSFREWNEIEPTGRSGSDEGFDIRAWQKGETITNISEEGEEGHRSFAGNLWQVQVKREKTITPARVANIIKETVNSKAPPYGFILAAAANISKKGADIFREKLRERGVREFYFWGKDYLEDQLARPENDEILFTFFGISLSPRRRSRTAEIKFGVNNKNKLLRLVFDKDVPIDQGVRSHTSFLLRDIKDRNYPYSGEYPDFERKRRWEEHTVAIVDPRGLYFQAREWYAYLDREKKRWDFSEAVDLSLRTHNLDKVNQRRLEDDGKKVEAYWRHLPIRNQGKLKVYGFVAFEDMLIIDDKGDPRYNEPHIFIDFDEKGPFSHRTATLLPQRGEPIYSEDLTGEYKRQKFFPSEFPALKRGVIHELDSLGLSGQALQTLQYLRGQMSLYSFGGKLMSLKAGDLIHVSKRNDHDADKYAEVTHLYETTVGNYANEHGEHSLTWLTQEAGRDLQKKDHVTILEIIEVYWSENKYLIYQDGRGW